MDISTEQHHFRIETDADTIVWLHVDKADAGTNVLSSEVLRELDRHLETIARPFPARAGHPLGQAQRFHRRRRHS